MCSAAGFQSHQRGRGHTSICLPDQGSQIQSWAASREAERSPHLPAAKPHLVGVLGCLRKVTMPADADIDLIDLSTSVLAGPNPQNLPGQVAAAHDMDGLYLQSNLSVPSGRLHEAHLTGPRWESCRDLLFREVSVACVSLSETHIRRPLPSACQPSSVVRTQA